MEGWHRYDRLYEYVAVWEWEEGTSERNSGGHGGADARRVEIMRLPCGTGSRVLQGLGC